jgi:hypothetical protein
MTRGFPSYRAIAAALLVARVRGEVSVFRQDPGTPGHFLLNTANGNSIVCVKRTRRLHGTVLEIEIEFREALSLLRLVILSTGMSREFWLWSPYGSMRFFRVEDAGLTELDLFGMVLKPLVPGLPAGKRAAWPKNLKHLLSTTVSGPGASGSALSGMTVSGKSTHLGKPVATVAVPGLQGASIPDVAPAKAGEKEPLSIRYLRHRNRELGLANGRPAIPEKGDPDNGRVGPAELHIPRKGMSDKCLTEPAQLSVGEKESPG